MQDKCDNLELHELKEALRKFSEERNWSQFHSPKNISMAIQVEAAELAAFFIWDSDLNSLKKAQDKQDAVVDELADVFIYLLYFSMSVNCDLIKVTKEKLLKNAEKYPVEKSRDNCLKYNEFPSSDIQNE